MLTSSKESGQELPSMVQRNTFKPTESPDTDVFDWLEAAMVPEPEMSDQEPEMAAVAERLVMLVQMVWSFPAKAEGGLVSTVMVTKSETDPQTPFETVHLKVFTPVPKAVTLLLGELEETIVPAPETNVQVPLPTSGVVAPNVAELVQMVWSLPAWAAEGG